MLPGNHRGLLGSAAAHTVTEDLAEDGADVYLFTLSFLPATKEAFVGPKGGPFF